MNKKRRRHWPSLNHPHYLDPMTPKAAKFYVHSQNSLAQLIINCPHLPNYPILMCHNISPTPVPVPYSPQSLRLQVPHFQRGIGGARHEQTGIGRPRHLSTNYCSVIAIKIAIRPYCQESITEQYPWYLEIVKRATSRFWMPLWICGAWYRNSLRINIPVIFLITEIESTMYTTCWHTIINRTASPSPLTAR